MGGSGNCPIAYLVKIFIRLAMRVNGLLKMIVLTDKKTNLCYCIQESMWKQRYLFFLRRH